MDESSSSSSRRRRREALVDMPRHFPDLEFSTNRYELHRHGRGESHHVSQPPSLIVYCRSTHEVQQVVHYCLQHDIAMIPFGAGTSLEGHVAAVQPDTLSIDVAKYMTTIHVLPNPHADDSDAYAVVDAGVTRLQLQAALKSSGYLFSVDPGADATLGGMAATGASGTTTVKWGTMKDNVLSVTAVLAQYSNGTASSSTRNNHKNNKPDGNIPPNQDDDDHRLPLVIETGSKALKNAAGYDLTSLLIGSEGTLGIITQLTVKLHPVPAHLVAVFCTFPTLHQAAQAVSLLLQCSVDLVRCELLDATAMQVFEHSRQQQASHPPHDDKDDNNKATGELTSTTTTSAAQQPALFLELAAVTEAALHEQVELVRDLLVQEPTDDDDGDTASSSSSRRQVFELAYDVQDRHELWKARHSLYYNAIAAGGGANAQAVVTDACVPLSQLANVLVATAHDVAQEDGVLGPCFGHAGDGNFHCILAVPDQYLGKNNPEAHEYWQKLQRIQTRLIQRTLAAGGTCTGEHGIGISKRHYLQQQYSADTLHTMKLVKQALDPSNLMNPGKIFLHNDEDDDEDPNA